MEGTLWAVNLVEHTCKGNGVLSKTDTQRWANLLKPTIRIVDKPKDSSNVILFLMETQSHHVLKERTCKAETKGKTVHVF